MPARRSYSRRRYSRRPMRRFRRTFKRARRVYRKRRGNTRIFNIARCGAIYRQGISDGYFFAGWAFSIAPIPSVSEYTNLWDQYKINCVVVKFRWSNQARELGDIQHPVPVFHYAIDYNDDATPTTPNELTQYQNYRSFQLANAKEYKIKLYPKSQSMTYKSAVTTGYSPKKQWINTSDPTVPHYGLKFAIDGSQAGGIGENALGVLEFQTKYYLSFKNVH